MRQRAQTTPLLIDRATADLARIAFKVMSGDIVVLKGAVAPDLVRNARLAAHEWGLSTPQSRSRPDDAGGATHLISYLPPMSDSRYILHSFEFSLRSQERIASTVRPVFEALHKIYCGLVGERFAFGETYDGRSQLGQCIQYPRGGGFFQEHFHQLKPQRIGLVLSASTHGKDYQIGGGRFRADDGSWIATEGRHDMGDVTLFRYDIGHDITPIDPDAPLDWKQNDGRWSFVMRWEGQE